MTARRIVPLLVLAFAVYVLLLGERAVALITDPRFVLKVLGVGVLLLPIVGVVMVVKELRFGQEAERLARRLASEGVDVREPLPRTPGGRPSRDAADEAFERRRAEVEADPGDWRNWFRLGVAYGDARDKPRGRRALRRAIEMEKSSRV
jgi:cytochrome c-type biogenesis protein CcmH/NrfG